MKLFPNVTRHRLVTHATHHHLTYLTNTLPIILLIFGAALNAILSSFSRVSLLLLLPGYTPNFTTPTAYDQCHASPGCFGFEQSPCPASPCLVKYAWSLLLKHILGNITDLQSSIPAVSIVGTMPYHTRSCTCLQLTSYHMGWLTMNPQQKLLSLSPNSRINSYSVNKVHQHTRMKANTCTCPGTTCRFSLYINATMKSSQQQIFPGCIANHTCCTMTPYHCFTIIISLTLLSITVLSWI